MLRSSLLAFVSLLFTCSLMAQDYSSAWKNITELQQKGKYRSALEATNGLYEVARRNGDDDTQLKALFHRAQYTQQLEEDGFEAMIDLLESSLSDSPAPAFRAVNHFVLGRAYSAYLVQAQGRGTAAQAELTGEQPLAEWPLERIANTATDHLLQALDLARENEVLLSDIPAIVQTGERLGYQMPTLYDVLVYQALDQLTANDGYLIGPAYAYRPAASTLFAPAQDFIEANFAAVDSSLLGRSLKIYQDLLAYHQKADRSAAFLHVNLKRLEWAFRQVADEEAYFERLQALLPLYRKNRDGGAILLKQVQLIQQFPSLGAAGEDDKPKARMLDMLKTIQAEYPKTEAAQLARFKEIDLLTPRLSLRTEEVLLPNQHALVFVSYRNAEQLYYRLYPSEFKLGYAEPQATKKILKGQAIQSARVSLGRNDDYNDHQTELALSPLQPGAYTLLVSSNPDFNVEQSPVAQKELVVSQLAALSIGGQETTKLQAVDRLTGTILPGLSAKLYRWNDDYRNRKLILLDEVTTDTKGQLTLPETPRNITVVLEKGADQLKIETNNYRRYSRDRSYEKDQFFTDRGIYRPGQPLYFKGIALQFDNEDCPSTQPNVSRTVTLFDANGQAVQEKTFTADTYGSFNGSFTLPTGGLNGRFRIASTHGAANFRVEAYKRPRFEVTFPDEQRTVAANETVTVTGKAMGYAGPPVAGAKVTYRVERKQQLYAWFSYYRYGGRAGDDAVITTGTTTTQEDGSFAIEFTAQVPPGDGQSYFRPSYQFVVSVDVADQTGETHNATTQLGVRQKGSAIGFTTPSLIDKDWKDFKINVNFVGDEAVPEKAINLSLQRVIHPNPAQLSRKWAFPDRPTISKEDFAAQFPLLPATKTPPVEEWKTVGGVTIERDIVVNSDTSVRIATDELAAGYYRIIIQYTDDSGEAQQRDYQLSVLNSSTNELPANMLYFFVPGEDGDYPVGRTIEQKLIAQMPLNAIFNSWGSRGIRTSLVTATNGKRLDFNYTPTKDDRGGISFKYAFVYHNRFFEQQASYRVPWREKELQITYETFRDKLRPGDQEEWRILIKDHNGQPVASQALASMYDASLDQILPFNWQQNLQLFPQNYYATIQFQPYQFRVNSTYGEYINKGKQERYLNFIPPSLDVSPLQLNAYGRISSFMDQAVAMEAAPASAPPPGRARSRAINSPESYTASAKAEDSAYSATVPEPSSSATVSIRKNLQETAFWQPALRTDADGNLVVSFKAPEALTRWKLQLFAHTPELANAYSSKEIVTQKELMILPNAPRFLREGDQIQFTAKVSNLAESSLTGVAYLELFDPETEAIIQDFKVAGIMQSASPGRSSHEIPVSLASEESKTVAWNITVPANAAGLIGYRVVVKAGNYSDGEQNVLPVLTNRVFLTASKPFYLKPGAKKTITLDALKNAASSRGNLQHQGFSFELTNDPSWLVVKSLPYLMEYPHQCAEQLANRYFANQLSYTIVNKNPALREVFKAWQKDPDALNSPLLRNQKLKQAAIEETPWLREAQDESKQNERLAVLFDLNQLAAEQETTLRLLEQRQHQNGSFSWFPGGPDNGYMSQYVAETMIRLEQLGALEEETRSRALNIARKTFDYLDFKMAEQYQRYLNNSKPKDRANYRPGTGILHYLYVRTIQFPGQQAIHPETQEAFDFYYGQAEKYWTEYGLYAQALLAITFQNKGSAKGREIVESLRERAIRKDEMGMYWKYPRGYSWQQLPIETHGRIMEAFAVHGAPSNELDEMRLYLLQNKRTNRWETTKATAAAAYAFLQTEGNTLQNTQEQAVKVNFPAARKSSYTTALAEAQASREAGTGYYRMQLPADEVSDKLAEVALKNKGKRIAWGGLHWQFTQDIDAVQANPDNPLGLQRKLFRRVNTASGQRLVEITEKNPIQAGDRLVVKLVITADRDMEYVHLKDRRAAGLEPTEQLSRYRYEGGLGFYFSPDDLAVHFFFDYLPRGTYTLEYDTFVNHAGDFSNGLSVLQSMYAPEFSTYSAGSRLVVE